MVYLRVVQSFIILYGVRKRVLVLRGVIAQPNLYIQNVEPFCTPTNLSSSCKRERYPSVTTRLLTWFMIAIASPMVLFGPTAYTSVVIISAAVTSEAC